jgi:beta-phosphoglucomutase
MVLTTLGILPLVLGAIFLYIGNLENDVEKGKPNPDVYLKAAEALKKTPSNCIVFEDSLAGVEAGNRAGAHVVGITSTHTPEELSSCIKTYSHFDEIDLDELLSLIK